MLLVREVEFQRAGIKTSLVGVAEIADSLCLVDSSSLRFVLDNLVDNAVRSMADAPRKVLQVAVDRTQTELTLRISDTGKGIDETMQTNIFNGRTSDRPDGGAGLFRTREILQKWRGEIQLLDSAPGQGTTFIVKLRAAARIVAPVAGNKQLRGHG